MPIEKIKLYFITLFGMDRSNGFRTVPMGSSKDNLLLIEDYYRRKPELK